MTRMINKTREPPDTALVPFDYPPDAHPALSYLSRLSPGSRVSQHTALRRMAATISKNTCTAETLPWHLLRYRHTLVLLH